MKLNKHIRFFLWNIFHPRVYIFILTGAAIIFLTFFTDNDALEIAISGIASVFIGIGVNNFSSLETHVKDEQKLKAIIGHSVKLMEMTKSRISRLANEASEDGCSKINNELSELEEFMSLGIQLIKENSSLN